MKFSLNRSVLKEAVGGLSKIIPTRVTLPILAGVRFTAGKDSVLLDGTDLDQHATYHAQPVEQEGAGSFVLPLTVLKDLTKGKDGEQVGFEAEGESVTLLNPTGSNVVRYPVAGLDPSEWPTVPTVVATQPADGFLDTYRRLVPFASSDNTRYVLNGVYVEVADKGDHPVTMVATDGRRLSLWNSMNLPIPTSFILPTAKFLSWHGVEGEVGIGLRTEREKKDVRVLGVALSGGPWYFDIKVIDGTYPNFRQVVPPADPAANRIVFTDEDVAALRKILPTFPGANTDHPMIALRPGADEKLVIGGRGPDDKTETTLELKGGSTFMGKLAGIAVNAFYLLDALAAGFRRFSVADALSPLRADDDRGGLHVLMPMKLGNDPAVTAEPAPTETKSEEVVTTPPAAEAEADNRKEITMPNEKDKVPPEPSALDKLTAAYELAKTKIREAQAALTDVAVAIKDAAREDKQRRAEVENVRAGLAKLQQIKV